MNDRCSMINNHDERLVDGSDSDTAVSRGLAHRSCIHSLRRPFLRNYFSRIKLYQHGAIGFNLLDGD